MNLRELDSFKLSDAVTFHSKLNPKLWNETHLRPEVRKQLIAIAQDFLSELGIHDLDVKDITVSGSNAAYSYTKHSDLDLHILVDLGGLDNDEVYKELFNAKKTIYNDSHDITIHGVPVELYVQDAREPVISLGEYSILNNEWLRIPTKRRANFDQNSSRAKYDKLLDIINSALKSTSLEKVNKTLKKIRQYRQAGLDKGGEFGSENLAYKALRSRGYITKLYDLRDKLHSQELTVETMYKQKLDKPTLNVRDLMKMHNVSLDHILTQLVQGINVESEHTSNEDLAREIALDHLKEDPNYYSKLKKAELEEEKEALPSKVYHVTPAVNVPAIMSQGLQPQVGDRSNKIQGETPAVYCFSDTNSLEDAMMNWLGDEFGEDEDLALLEINTSGLKGDVTPNAEYEIQILEPIPPQNIKVLSQNLATMVLESTNLNEAFDQPYPIKWEKSEHGDYDAMATLPDGKPLTIMFDHTTPYEVTITFWRNNNLELTGEGDSQRVFATVLQAIQEFLKIEQPANISFSASKEVEPGQKAMSRSSLYDKLVKRYAQKWGYNAQTFDHGEGVEFNLTRKQNVAEASGYIPSEKEKNDPRFKTALTVDVKPDSIKKNAKAFSWLTNRAGIPPTANPSGKF